MGKTEGKRFVTKQKETGEQVLRHDSDKHEISRVNFVSSKTASIQELFCLKKQKHSQWQFLTHYHLLGSKANNT